MDQTCSPTRPFDELDRLTCLRPILVASLFGIRLNLLLFHLDRSHRWNFTILKRQELVLSNNIQIDLIKRQRLAEHLGLPTLYEEFECSSESTSFRKCSFYKIVKTPIGKRPERAQNAAKSPLAILYEIKPNRYDGLSLVTQKNINVKFGR